KATLFNEQPSRVDAWAVAAIPAQWPRPDSLVERGNSLTDAPALSSNRHLVVLLPAPAMTAHVVAGLRYRLRGWRIAFKRQGATEYCERQPTRLKRAVNTPEANPAAIFEHRFRREVALLQSLRTRFSQ